MVDSSIALIILCAGRSARMGEPKALLRFGNWTTLELLVRTAAAAGVGRVVTVIGHRAEEIRAAHSFTGMGLDFSWVLNRTSESEQIHSLRMGLSELNPAILDAFLFQPVDHPLVTREDFQALINAHRKHDGPEKAFVPTHNQRRGHPVLCRASARQVFLDLPPGGTARDALEEMGIVQVEVSNPGILEDMDTREDYKRVRSLFQQRWTAGGMFPRKLNPPRGMTPG